MGALRVLKGHDELFYRLKHINACDYPDSPIEGNNQCIDSLYKTFDSLQKHEEKR